MSDAITQSVNKLNIAVQAVVDAVASELDASNVKIAALQKQLADALSHPTPTVPTPSQPVVMGLLVTPQAGRKLEIKATPQVGLIYNLATQEDTSKPVVQGPQGITLPTTIDSPAAGQVYGLIVTPVRGGVTGTPSKVLVDFTKISLPQGGGTQPPVSPPVITLPVPVPIPASPAPFGVDVRQEGLATIFDGRSCLPDDQRTKYTWSWDFGDGSKGYGFTVNHIFEKAGIYNVTLSIGNLPTVRRQISVGNSTRKVIAVGVGDLAKTIAGDNAEFILAPGVYSCSSTVRLGTNVIIRGGGKALVNGRSPVDLFVTNDNTRIDGLTMDFPAAAGYRGQDYGPCAAGVYAKGNGVAVTNCTFLNVSDAIQGNMSPTGVLVQGCIAPLIDGIAGYFCFVQGNLWTITANKVANCRINHVVRVEANAIGGSVYGNIFANVATAQSGVPGDNSKACFEIHYGADWYVFGNDFTGQSVNGGGDCAFGPLRLNAQPGNPERVIRCVCIGNTFHGANCGIDAGASDIVVIGNRFLADQAWPVNAAIVIHATDDRRQRDVENVFIGGNIADDKYQKLKIVDGVVKGLNSDWSSN